MILLMLVLANESMSVSSMDSSLVFSFLVVLEKVSGSAMAVVLAVAGAIQLSGFTLVGVITGELTRAQAAQGSVVCSQPQK